jgi:hypothetical protein
MPNLAVSHISESVPVLVKPRRLNSSLEIKLLEKWLKLITYKGLLHDYDTVRTLCIQGNVSLSEARAVLWETESQLQVTAEKSAGTTSSALFAGNKYHKARDNRGPREDWSHSKDRGLCGRNAAKGGDDLRGNRGNCKG